MTETGFISVSVMLRNPLLKRDGFVNARTAITIPIRMIGAVISNIFFRDSSSFFALFAALFSAAFFSAAALFGAALFGGGWVPVEFKPLATRFICCVLKLLAASNSGSITSAGIVGLPDTDTARFSNALSRLLFGLLPDIYYIPTFKSIQTKERKRKEKERKKKGKRKERKGKETCI